MTVVITTIVDKRGVLSPNHAAEEKLSMATRKSETRARLDVITPTAT